MQYKCGVARIKLVIFFVSLFVVGNFFVLMQEFHTAASSPWACLTL